MLGRGKMGKVVTVAPEKVTRALFRTEYALGVPCSDDAVELDTCDTIIVAGLDSIDISDIVGNTVADPVPMAIVDGGCESPVPVAGADVPHATVYPEDPSSYGMMTGKSMFPLDCALTKTELVAMKNMRRILTNVRVQEGLWRKKRRIR